MDRDGRNTKARPRSARIAIAAFECVALIVGVTLSGVTAQLLQPTQAFALNVQSASFNPTSARNGTALVLTVTTSNDVKCVRVSGDHSATQTNAASASVWTFNLTAGSGDGTKNVTVTAFKTTTCDGSSDAGSASYLLDNTNPTVIGTRTPAANANGWNNTNVGVSFTCSDNVGGAGLQSCSPVSTTLTSEGAGQFATGTATDKVGNTGSATVSNINIDKTAPALSGAPATSANGAGWYSGDVSIHWTCTDAVSGVGTSCPANSTISGEGTGLTASASVSDLAGNSTSATSTPAVNIDRTKPVTNATAPPAWNNTNVTVTLSATDALSGVAATQWSLDGGPTQTGTSVPVSTDGDHILSFGSVDRAGNVETAHTIHVKIDKTPPTISHTQSPLANANGWNNTDVTVTFACADAVSGIPSCVGSTTLFAEGAHQSVIGTATDNAGNTASDPAFVNIDKTKPTVSVSRDRSPNADGWYKAPVTVTSVCGDALSGVDTCSAAQNVGEGLNQSVSGTAKDAAGNTATATTAGINVDQTAPTLTGVPTTSPNADGWYHGNVVIHWACSDALSGVVACPPDSVITGAGTALTATASVSDHAGNTTLATSAPVNIDRMAPTTTSDAPSGWQVNDVVVHFTASDDLSGVKATHYAVNGGATQTGSSVGVTTEGSTVISFWSDDVAGNVEAPHFVEVKLDRTAPTVTHSQAPASNGKGWNNTDVTVSFACSDAVSGIANCPGDVTLSSEGANEQATRSATDNAGNATTDTATVSIDKTAPTITAGSNSAPNANGWHNASVTVNFSCTDDTSGIASCAGPQTFGEGAHQSATGTATDNADNTASTSLHEINVDTTPPTLSGAPTTSPNDAGWYHDDVTVEWTCADALSGVAGACPPANTITGEGDGLSVSSSVNDRAGNATSASVDNVKIDRTPPSTNASAPSGWVNDAVTVSLDATDNLSGIATTHWILDGGSEQTGASADITAEGVHTLEYWSVDAAGNAEEHHTVSVSIDKTAPTITHAQSPEPNDNGWNNADVTVTFTCDDQPGLSGIASCTAPHTVTSEGTQQPVAGTAKDNAGNEATDTAHVSIDKTKPTITGAPDREPNENGWYRADVTAHFSCDDALSGVTSCTGPVTLGEGAAQSVTGTAVDAAGNTEHAAVTGINVDETAPALTGAPTTAPNAAGWYRDDVLVQWACHDDLSGISGACPGDSTVTGEGDNLSASQSVADLAGNVSDATVSAIHIDRTAPTTTSDAPSAWQNTDVMVTFTAHDGLSGVAATRYVIDGGATHDGTVAAVHGEGAHALEFWSVDAAGNEEAHHNLPILIDTTPPSISHSQVPPPNANGWNNTHVSVTFDCSDAGSGVASCPAGATLTDDGASQLVTGTASDNARNTASDAASVNIDQTKPTITSSRDRGPNANDWYNGDVTVSFSCADALSGVASCSGPHAVAQGAHQSVTGAVTDLAGNDATVTDSDVNVDKTPPALSGAPTTAPNANGWYSDDVTIHWTCSDGLSGIDGSCPADSVITGEGDNLSATSAVSDLAGNQVSATVSGIKIDRTAPSTTASAPSNWVNDDVTVALSATDGLSDVAATYYSLDGGPAQTGASAAISSEGVHTLSYWSVDRAGNEEPHATITIRIDKTNPTIIHTNSPVANANGWNNSDVTVTFACDDQAGLSGIASCTSPTLVTTEGLGQVVPGLAKDNAGNTASDSATLNVDKTPPTIAGAPDRAPNAADWYRDDVKVTFACDDALSGIVGCASPALLGEGAHQSVSGTAADAAGNGASTSVGPINIDKTPPSISGAPTTAPNGAGWYADDVTVHWSCGDALSGIAGSCPADTAIHGEGAALSTSASVLDLADNNATATASAIKIDRTAPLTTSDAPIGWQKTNVTVHFAATDNLSGVAGMWDSVDGGPAHSGSAVTVTMQGTHTLAFWSVDAAGNVESAHSVLVQIDKTLPSITGAPTTSPNGAGWYRAPVTVHFSCADQVGLSGLASCAADQTLASSGANQSSTGIASDNAANIATYTVGGLNVDLAAPTVVINGVTDGATYALGAAPVASCSAADALSGPKSCSGIVTGGNNGVGTFTYTATATDVAGNTATRSVSYQVVYRFSGFLQPINDTAHQVGAQTSIFKAGSTVPVKFELRRADGSAAQPSSAPQWLTPVKGASLSAAVDESLYTAVATSGDTYRSDTGQYIYNWSTKGLPSGYYYRIGVRLDDGTTYTVNIGLR